MFLFLKFRYQSEEENTMVNKKFLLGMLAMAVVFGMMVVGCDNGTKETIYDPTGTWDFNINGQPATVIVSGNNYTFSGAGYTDAGTFTLSGNVATLYSNTWNANIGTATFTSNTTITLNLTNSRFITGVFVGAKRL